jgi:hypothetical protein
VEWNAEQGLGAMFASVLHLGTSPARRDSERGRSAASGRGDDRGVILSPPDHDRIVPGRRENDGLQGQW